MGAHKKYDLESIKQERWFYIIPLLSRLEIIGPEKARI